MLKRKVGRIEISEEESYVSPDTNLSSTARLLLIEDCSFHAVRAQRPANLCLRRTKGIYIVKTRRKHDETACV